MYEQALLKQNKSSASHSFILTAPPHSHTPGPGEQEWKEPQCSWILNTVHIYNFFSSGMFCNDIDTFIFTTSKDDNLSNDTDVANFLLLFIKVILIDSRGLVKLNSTLLSESVTIE